MLGEGTLGYGKALSHISMKAAGIIIQKFQYGNAHRMSQGLGIGSYFFVIAETYCWLGWHESALVKMRKYDFKAKIRSFEGDYGFMGVSMSRNSVLG